APAGFQEMSEARDQGFAVRRAAESEQLLELIDGDQYRPRVPFSSQGEQPLGIFAERSDLRRWIPAGQRGFNQVIEQGISRYEGRNDAPPRLLTRERRQHTTQDKGRLAAPRSSEDDGQRSVAHLGQQRLGVRFPAEEVGLILGLESLEADVGAAYV